MSLRAPPFAVRRARALLRALGGCAVVVVASVRCDTPLLPEPLLRFETCAELHDYLADQLLYPSSPPPRTLSPLVGCADALVSVPQGDVDGAEERNFSGTTRLEPDVDEGDFVKNDADTLFVVRRGSLYAVRAWPADELQIAGTLGVDGVPYSLLLWDRDADGHSERALVLARAVGSGEATRTIATLVDVTDTTSLVPLRRLEVDGVVREVRLIEDRAFLVAQATLHIDATPRSVDEVPGPNAALPQLVVDGVARPAASCEDVLAPEHSDGKSVVVALSLSLADPDADVETAALLVPLSSIYLSGTSTLYLTSVFTTDGGYFTPDLSVTHIHKLRIDEDGRLSYRGSGAVAGKLHDDSSLDEVRGADGSTVLHAVVTDDTRSTDSDDTSYLATSLLALEEDPDGHDTLVEVGRSEDIGRGEEIASVRFFGPRAYVVTYPTGAALGYDALGFPLVPGGPLVVIDRSDPRAPAVRGQVAGGAMLTFAQPIGGGATLLAVGALVDGGAVNGLDISVFDVLDPDRPALVAQHTFGVPDASSEALIERHAITTFVDELGRTVLAVPVQRATKPGSDAPYQTGLEAFVVATDAVTPIGRLEQRGLYTDFADPLDRVSGYCASVRRSAFIGDANGSFVYAVSTGGISVAALDDTLPVVASVQFPGALQQDLCDASGSPL